MHLDNNGLILLWEVGSTCQQARQSISCALNGPITSAYWLEPSAFAFGCADGTIKLYAQQVSTDVRRDVYLGMTEWLTIVRLHFF